MATKPSELDPEVAFAQLFFILGAASAGNPLDKEMRKTLWRLLPYIQALQSVGLDNPEKLRRDWWEALQLPGPFGLPFNIEVDADGLPSMKDGDDDGQ